MVLGPSVNREAAASVRAGKRQVTGRPVRHEHGARLANAAVEVLAESRALGWPVGVGLWQRHLHREHARRDETRVDAQQAREALQEQTGAAKHDERQRDFDGDEQAPRAHRGTCDSARAAVKHDLQTARAARRKRRQAKEQRADDRHRHGEEQHA